MDSIYSPWPWWVAGPLIGLTVPLLFLLAGKSFGVSTSLQQIGAMCTPSSGPSYLTKFNWRKGSWLLIFVAGVITGAGLPTSSWSQKLRHCSRKVTTVGWALSNYWPAEFWSVSGLAMQVDVLRDIRLRELPI